MMTPLELMLIYILSPLILTIGGGWVGWFFGRKRQKVDTLNAETETFNKINAALADQTQKLLDQNKVANEQIERLTEEVKKLREEVELLKGYAKENERLKKTNVKYEKLLDTHNIDY